MDFVSAALDGAILAWLVYVDVRDRREKRVKAICPECLEEHDMTVVHADEVVALVESQK